MASLTSTDHRIIVEFTKMVASVDHTCSTPFDSRVLVLKHNGELFYLDPFDQTCMEKCLKIQVDDMTHLAWKRFECFSEMESFIKESKNTISQAVNDSQLQIPEKSADDG